ncbi:hypothetical protein [Streptomyces lydicus]|uniref:hypothetical protein n=1 Tax=Streptomyces lydicus TaxID=47763 RepID=UPI003F4D92AB
MHLAGRDEQAEFLWQFAAGAGKSASAECRYLLHLPRGELRHSGEPPGLYTGHQLDWSDVG